ncbi:hypothetical protein OH76DRAFT_1423183 [Lentinus brumalis]|uniref:Uncharacterized protein n=1 Tax=Lentinus brumalis TaxID=2498619 RepID=A0A371CM38_9APHY|nr:hypothetical protein OH76DRAFT_1423183 [Polyporus brumalis]
MSAQLNNQLANSATEQNRTPPPGNVLIAATPEDGEIVENAPQAPDTPTPMATVAATQAPHTTVAAAGGGAPAPAPAAGTQGTAPATPPRHEVRVGRPRSNAIRLPHSPLFPPRTPPGIPMPTRLLPAEQMIAAPQVGPTPTSTEMHTPNEPTGAGDAEQNQQVRRQLNTYNGDYQNVLVPDRPSPGNATSSLRSMNGWRETLGPMTCLNWDLEEAELRSADQSPRNKMSLSELLATPTNDGRSGYREPETLNRAQCLGSERPVAERANRDRSSAPNHGDAPQDPRNRPSEANTPKPGGGRPRHGTPFPFQERIPQREVPRHASAYAPPAQTRAAAYLAGHRAPRLERRPSSAGGDTPMDVDRALDELLAEEDDLREERDRYGSATPREARHSGSPDKRSEQDSWEEGPARHAEEGSESDDPPPAGRGRYPWDDGDESEPEEDDDGMEALPTCMTQGPSHGLERPMPTPASPSIPIIAIDDPEMFIRGISDDWIRAIWKKTPEKESLPIYIYNYRFMDSVSFHRLAAKALRAAAISITGNPEVRAVPPEAQHEGEVRGDEALLWAVRGLSKDDVQALLSRPIWSFPGITFFALPKDIGPGRWVFSLEGFLDDDADAIRCAVQHVLLEAENVNTIAKLTKWNPEFRGMTSAQRIQEIIGSVEVTTWTTSNDNVIANIFIFPPTRVTRLWREWVSSLRTRRYGNYTNGTGTVRRLSHCLGCRSADHPTHLCPYPELTGWNGPDAGSGSFSRHIQGPQKRERRQQERDRARQRTGTAQTRPDSNRDRWGGPPRAPMQRSQRGTRR